MLWKASCTEYILYKDLAIGVSGNEKRHRITPIFVDERQNYKELPETEGFILFNEDNIDEYYIKEIPSNCFGHPTSFKRS